MTNRDLSALKNLGATITIKLGEIGIYSESDLRRVGPAAAYRLMQKHEGKKLPVCYYLYSLAGALEDKHWDDLSDQRKKELLIDIGR
jgi:DNA transformation protein